MTQFVFLPEMGCSGDMVLSALADLGAETEIRDSLKLSLGADVSFKETSKNGVRAKMLQLNSDEKCSPLKIMELIRSAADILEFDEPQMRFAWDTFETIIEAEKSVHGIGEVHLHEVGRMDTVVDIVGATVGLTTLGAFESDVISSPIAVGKQPAPAAIRILKSRKFNFYQRDIAHELCTPTGASIMVNLARKVEKPKHTGRYREGCGGGSMDFHLPNVLRVRII